MQDLTRGETGAAFTRLQPAGIIEEKKKLEKKREMAQWQVALHVAPTCCALKKMDKLLQKAFISSTCKDSLVVKICV